MAAARKEHARSRPVLTSALLLGSAGLLCFSSLGSAPLDSAFVAVPATSNLGLSLGHADDSIIAAQPEASAPRRLRPAQATADPGWAGVAAVWALPLALGVAASLGKRSKGGRQGAVVTACKAQPEAFQAGDPSEQIVHGTFPQRPTPLLDALDGDLPQSLRRLSMQQLNELAEEVRWQVLDATSVTGGHLSSGLGVVELTIALHYVFDTPRDEICWDVAHQVYPHKILTGRRDRIYTLRQAGGLSGFAKRSESEYDAFGAGHSSTSISAALGFQEARKMQGLPGHSVAVIGDGAITGGMAWEAMNHAGGLKSKIMVILNDNGQVSLPTFYNDVDTPVGALSATLGESSESSQSGIGMQNQFAKMETSELFQKMRRLVKNTSKALPGQAAKATAKLEEYMRDFIKTAPFQGSGSGAHTALFEELGFAYVGPIDGHDTKTLVEVMSNLKRQHQEGLLDKPVLLHVKTKKGKGYEPAEMAKNTMHVVKPAFNLPPAENLAPAKKTMTQVFAESLIKEAEQDEKIVAITAAMPDGTGISAFQKRFGNTRTFDVGIAEQHAVTFAAGLAAGGLKPFCAVYSTFMQRAYDQIVHDVALQNLPVRLVLDRGGLVGSDGATHGGTFDLTYLCCVPNMLVCAPADEADLADMIHTLAKIDDKPAAIRYPRGSVVGVEIPEERTFLEPGKGRIVREGSGKDLVIVSLGGRLQECMKAAERLEGWGVSATVCDARWAKPIDTELIGRLASEHKAMITIEENAIGGFSAIVQQELLNAGYLDGNKGGSLALRSMVLPDRWISHDTQEGQYDDAELNALHIVTKAVTVLNSIGVKVEPREATSADYFDISDQPLADLPGNQEVLRTRANSS